MTARLDVRPKATEQNRIVRTGKYEVEVTNNKKLHSRYCTSEAMKLTTDRYEASRGLFATAELLVKIHLHSTLLLNGDIIGILPTPYIWKSSLYIDYTRSTVYEVN